MPSTMHLTEAHFSPIKCAMPSTMLVSVLRLLVCANRDITVPAHDIPVYVP